MKKSNIKDIPKLNHSLVNDLELMKKASDASISGIFLPDSKSRKGTNNKKGTGLGLTLCNEFIKANGGNI